jgi:hypothetical protein
MIRMEGDDAALPPGILLWLDSPEDLFGEETVAPSADSSFVFANIPPGRYRIHVRSGQSAPYYLKMLRYGGIESSGAAFSFSDAADSMELTLSAHGALVNGSIKRKDATGAATAQVVLVPNTADAEAQLDETRLGVLDQSGAFTVKDAVRPGEYTLYAFEGAPDSAWTDAEFMKGIDGKGVRITVSEGDVKTIEVPLIERPDIAALLIRLGMN